MKLFTVYCLLFILLLFTIHYSPFTEAWGRVYIDINAPEFKRIPIAVVDFRGLGGHDPEGHGKRIAEVIRTDLDFSGFFEVLDPTSFIEDPNRAGLTSERIDFKDWSAVGAEALVKGGITVEGKNLTIEARLFDVFQGRMMVGKRYKGELNDLRQMAHKFSNEIVKSITGEEGIFETSIVFIMNKERTKEIYEMDYDGHSLRALTSSGTLNMSPSGSPDGYEIVFSSERNRSWGIYLIDVKSKEEKKISTERGLNISPSFSPDGKRIAFTLSKDGNSDIYVVNKDGSGLKRLTNNQAIDVSPSWSPDGDKIAFVSDRGGSPQIYIMDSNGGDLRRITFEGSYNASPKWSPRGDKIVFASRRNGSFQICIMNPDGSGLEQLTGSGNNEGPSWSPDGRYIVFSSTRNGRTGIYTMRANGENQKRITPEEAVAISPSWSLK